MYADGQLSEVDLTGALSTGAGPEPGLDAITTSRITDTLAASKAPATRRAYRSDWDRFDRWCWRENHTALPAHPAVVAAYLVDAAAAARTPMGERAYSAGDVEPVGGIDQSCTPGRRTRRGRRSRHGPLHPRRDPPHHGSRTRAADHRCRWICGSLDTAPRRHRVGLFR